MADKKKMPVAEILAAARKADSGKADDRRAAEAESPAEPSEKSSISDAVVEAAETRAAQAMAASDTVESPAKSEEPAANPKPAGGARPSVAEMLAAARAGGKGGVKKPAEAEPHAKSAAPKPGVAKPAATKVTEKGAEKPAKATAKPATAAAKPVAAALPAGSTKDTASILAAARTHAKPGPLTKAEAAARLKPESFAPAKRAKPVVPPVPPKPSLARHKPAVPTPVVDDRRGFLAFVAGAGSLVAGSFLGVGFTSLAATLGLWTLGTARFMFPNVLVEPPSKFKVGFPSDFAPGQVEEKFKAQFGVWVAKAEYQGQFQIYALRTVCTHLGCTPNWLEGEQKFKCPCHGSGFYKDGINFEGPAPRPLERYAIRLADDGQLEIDKSKLFQQEMGQWNDPASFVPV
jgi:cytochrome b6-f complex iron-sulfur subunit